MKSNYWMLVTTLISDV